jgi:uncharacterized protein with HEPN domain
VRDDGERLRDILEAIGNIEKYSARGQVSFEQDELLQTWFVRNLQIISEAARNLSDAARSLAPDVPWAKITGMRHILVHHYFDIDLQVVWNAVAHDLPELKPKIVMLLEKLESEGNSPRQD